MKLIAIDMDGTLLNSAGRVTAENAAAIKQAQAQGIEVVIATGRTYYTASGPLREADLRIPIICLNGADVRDQDGRQLTRIPLDASLFLEVDQACQEHGVHLEVCTNEGIYSKSKEKSLQIRLDIAQSANEQADEERVRRQFADYIASGYLRWTDHFQPLLDRGIDIYKLLLFSLDQEALAHVKHTFIACEAFCITSSAHHNLEINHRDAQKGIALERWAAKRGIDMSEVVAIGDNLNDLSMLQKAGRSVAMGNAEEAVKRICHWVTKTNNEHGVAYAIREMLQNV
jgi:Cof subfamily protein (haloacid dehalogenase superfamily)